MGLQSRSITYSPAYTLVPTYECFNRCSYCNFRIDPGEGAWLTLAQAEAQLQVLKRQGVIEILILSGEVHPQSARRSDWMQRLYDLGELALSLKFLPHTNAGPLQFAEMVRLKQVNVSMGLMLEQMTPRLLKTVHRHAPSKVPDVRLQQLAWAGELQIPFTTGLLLGIGETKDDRQETLETIADMHQDWGHIQEVILQPHSPGGTQVWQGNAFHPEEFLEVIQLSRQILPTDIAIQIPPNLIQTPELLIACIEAGARDLGGIGPKDEVNPDYAHPCPEGLKSVLDQAGWQLVPRLPIYSQYDRWLPERLKVLVENYRSGLDSHQF